MDDNYLVAADQRTQVAQAQQQRAGFVGGERGLLPELSAAGPHHADRNMTRNQVRVESGGNRKTQLILPPVDLVPFDQVVQCPHDFPGKALNPGDRLTQEPSIDDDPVHVSGRRPPQLPERQSHTAPRPGTRSWIQSGFPCTRRRARASVPAATPRVRCPVPPRREASLVWAS